MEGRRVTAAIKDRYQTIVPVGSIIAITYQSPRENHGGIPDEAEEGIVCRHAGSADADAQCWKGGEFNISDILLEHNE